MFAIPKTRATFCDKLGMVLAWHTTLGLGQVASGLINAELSRGPCLGGNQMAQFPSYDDSGERPIWGSRFPSPLCLKTVSPWSEYLLAPIALSPVLPVDISSELKRNRTSRATSRRCVSPRLARPGQIITKIPNWKQKPSRFSAPKSARAFANLAGRINLPSDLRKGTDHDAIAFEHAASKCQRLVGMVTCGHLLASRNATTDCCLTFCNFQLCQNLSCCKSERPAVLASSVTDRDAQMESDNQARVG